MGLAHSDKFIVKVGGASSKVPPILKRSIMKDSDFITFQDDFYDLLEKYGVKNIDGDHKDFNKICDKRNNIADFIDELNGDEVILTKEQKDWIEEKRVKLPLSLGK